MMRGISGIEKIVRWWFAAAAFALAAGGVLCGVAFGAEPPQSHGESETVLLDFYADWCGPCQSMRPIVDRLEREGVRVQRINIDVDRDTADRLGIGQIPTFLVVDRGREVKRFVGSQSEETLSTAYEETRKKRQKKDEEGKGRKKGKPNPQFPAPSPPSPTPAWRYEPPAGHRAAAVRIHCKTEKQACKGSGVFVRWHHGRVFVVTARHVVAEMDEIAVETCTHHFYRAKVVAMDAAWDCAVLDIGGVPPDVQPAEVELGDDAMYAKGERVESCGYGPDGRMAVNDGLFIAYGGFSRNDPNRPDDLFLFSGYNREGDSGGPIFSERGRVVGVMLGHQPAERIVVGVQAGRIHKALNAADPKERPAGAIPYEKTSAPTPPETELVPIEQLPQACDCGGVCPTSRDKQEKTPRLPWRADEEAEQRNQDARIAQLIELERLRAHNAAQPSRPTPDNREAAENPKEAKSDGDASPLAAALSIVAAVAAGFLVYFAVPK